MRSRRPLLAALVAVVVSLFGPTTAAAPAPVAPGAACSGTSGVTVVVDFAALGGGTQVRCAPGDPGSGLEALSSAGFAYGFVPRRPGMVCTIDSRPDPCNGAPADAYWSYWHAPRGGSWTYSNEGAGTRDPAPGSVEGWAFGAGARPSTAPPAPTPTTTTTTTTTTAPARTPAPAPSPAPAPAPAPDTAAPEGTTSSGGPPPADSSTTEATGADATTTTPATDTDPTDTDDTVETTDTDDENDDDDGDDGRDEQALGATPTSDDGGGGAGAFVGVVLALALAGTALWEVRRRRAPA